MTFKVISEIGSNHGGSVRIAIGMIEESARCGVHAVKFQKRDNRSLFTREYYDAPYNSEQAYGKTYGEHREALELDFKELQELQLVALANGVEFHCTAFDKPSVDVLFKLGVDGLKIASGCLTDDDLISHAAASGLPLYISTGGAKEMDVKRAVSIVQEHHNDFCIMQCTASYPCKYEDLNLNVLKSYAHKFPGVTLGVSLHDNGIAMGPVAYVLGARVFEKHFTLDRTMKGTDHAFSLEPQGLKKFVRDLKRTEVALGFDRKLPLECEKEPIRKMSKSIVAARGLSAGHLLSISDIAYKSPGGGLPPWARKRVLGRRLLIPISEDTMITDEILDGTKDVNLEAKLKYGTSDLRVVR